MESDLIPPGLKYLADNIMSRQNILGVTKEQGARWAQGLDLPRRSGTVFFAGCAGSKQYRAGKKLLAAGDYEQACKVLLAVDILYDYPELASRALAGAADCFDALGRPEKAAETRADLLERFPDSDAAKALGQGEAARAQ